jgi:hypothetical protein
MSQLRVKSGTAHRNVMALSSLSCAKVGGLRMTSPASELFIAIVKLATEQLRFGLVAAEIAASGARQMAGASVSEVVDAAVRPPSSFDAEIDAAAGAIKAKLLGGRDGGFRNMLHLNFPDDEIRAMAEAALTAARRVTYGSTHLDVAEPI